MRSETTAARLLALVLTLGGCPSPKVEPEPLRVLQQEPLEGDDLHVRDGASAALGPQLQEYLLLGAVLADDAQRVADPVAGVELDPEPAEALGP